MRCFLESTADRWRGRDEARYLFSQLESLKKTFEEGKKEETKMSSTPHPHNTTLHPTYGSYPTK